MTPELQSDLMAALERPHRLGTIGGDLEEQLAHCASFSSVLAQVLGDRVPKRAMDLGTGGGLPGVVLATLWPATQWTLVDMREARAIEVERTVLRLRLGDRVDVITAEAQHLGHDERFRERCDVVVARAFGPPSITAECAAGVTAVGGYAIISEPPGADDAADTADRWNEEGLAALGLGAPTIVTTGASSFAVFEKVCESPERVPRLPARSNRGWILPR